ncbi:hypothetical protein ACFL34_02400 [Candidatus Sumerlaeota bacterium]
MIPLSSVDHCAQTPITITITITQSQRPSSARTDGPRKYSRRWAARFVVVIEIIE